MTEPIQSVTALPANRAFVVQFRAATTNGKAPFEGRVEHLASGRAHYFSSQQELSKIFDALLPDAHADRTGGSQ